MVFFVAKYFSMQQSPDQINVKCLKFEVPKIKVFYQYIMTALKARASILAHFSSLHISNLLERPEALRQKNHSVFLFGSDLSGLGTLRPDPKH